MKFRVERDVLADAVAWTARSLPSRPTVPVLAGLRLVVDDATLTFTAYDYEVFAQMSVDADVTDDGAVVVSGRLLAEITRSLPGKPVELVSDGSRVVLTCGASRFTLATLDSADLPPLPDLPETTGTAVAATFAEAVAQVSVAAGRDDMLPVLTGVRVEIDGERMTLAATDRYRLAVREVTWTPAAPDLSTRALIPARTLAETAKSLTGGTVDIGLPADGAEARGIVGFTHGTRRSATRLLDGEFPKYQTLFPAEALTVARVDTAALVESVKRVALVAERNTPVKLAFTAGEVVLDASSGDQAEAYESLPAELTGDPITIGFNPSYLLDGLGAIGAATAQLSFTQAARPAVLQAAPADAAATGGDTDGGDTSGDAAAAAARGGYRYLLMPVRLAG
jgi:DNA polymerase-3 subunit beta